MEDLDVQIRAAIHAVKKWDKEIINDSPEPYTAHTGMAEGWRFLVVEWGEESQFDGTATKVEAGLVYHLTPELLTGVVTGIQRG